MTEWSADAAVFLAQFKNAHPDFYERMLSSKPFLGDESALVSTTEAEIAAMDPVRVYASYLAFVAKTYAKDLTQRPNENVDRASPATTVGQLRSLAAGMSKMTWHFEDLKALDHARHVLEAEIENLNQQAGFIAPKGEKRAPIDVAEARRLLTAGVPRIKVARKFRVSPGTLDKLVGSKMP